MIINKEECDISGNQFSYLRRRREGFYSQPLRNPFIQTFVHGDRITGQTLESEDRIIFDAPTISIGNATHLIHTPNFYIWQAGYYDVTFTVYNYSEPCQFSIFTNGVLIPMTTCGSLKSTGQLILSTIIFISSSDILGTPTQLSPNGFAALLELVNQTGSSVTLSSPVNQNQLVASFSANLLLAV